MFSLHQLQLTCYIRVVLQEPEYESYIGVNFSEILITGKKSSSKPSKKG